MRTYFALSALRAALCGLSAALCHVDERKSCFFNTDDTHDTREVQLTVSLRQEPVGTTDNDGRGRPVASVRSWCGQF